MSDNDKNDKRKIDVLLNVSLTDARRHTVSDLANAILIWIARHDNDWRASIFDVLREFGKCDETEWALQALVESDLVLCSVEECDLTNILTGEQISAECPLFYLPRQRRIAD